MAYGLLVHRSSPWCHVDLTAHFVLGRDFEWQRTDFLLLGEI